MRCAASPTGPYGRAARDLARADGAAVRRPAAAARRGAASRPRHVRRRHRAPSALLGRVVEALRARGTLDDTIVVVLADHGEILGERGGYFGHGPRSTRRDRASRSSSAIRRASRPARASRRRSPRSACSRRSSISPGSSRSRPSRPARSRRSRRAARPAAGPVLSELARDRRRTARATRARRPADADGPAPAAYRDGQLKLVETRGRSVALRPRRRSGRDARPRGRAPGPARRGSPRSSKRRARGSACRGSTGSARDALQAPELDAATQERLRELGYGESTWASLSFASLRDGRRSSRPPLAVAVLREVARRELVGSRTPSSRA